MCSRRNTVDVTGCDKTEQDQGLDLEYPIPTQLVMVFEVLLRQLAPLSLAGWVSGAVFFSWGCHDKGPQNQGMRQQKCVVSQFWRLETETVSPGLVPSKGNGGESAPGMSPGSCREF
jgi:hypothetical protein